MSTADATFLALARLLRVGASSAAAATLVAVGRASPVGQGFTRDVLRRTHGQGGHRGHFLFDLAAIMKAGRRTTSSRTARRRCRTAWRGASAARRGEVRRATTLDRQPRSTPDQGG